MYINIKRLQIYDNLLDFPNLFWSIFYNWFKHLYGFEITQRYEKYPILPNKKGRIFSFSLLFYFLNIDASLDDSFVSPSSICISFLYFLATAVIYFTASLPDLNDLSIIPANLAGSLP